MTFGDKLTKLRKQKNLTQEQLADMLGVSRQSVSKWESDTAYPETDKLISLAKLFKCSTDYLLKDECANTAEKYSKKENILSHQKIIGYILLAVSLIAGILILLLAEDEESLLLSLIISATIFSCSLVCLFVKQNAGYWCAWAGFAPFIILSPHIVSMTFLARIDFAVLCFYIIMFFIARKIFNIKLITTRKKSRLVILGWVLFVIINLCLYMAPFFITEGISISPLMYIQMDLIRYITVALLLTYTVCYVKNSKLKK